MAWCINDARLDTWMMFFRLSASETARTVIVDDRWRCAACRANWWKKQQEDSAWTFEHVVSTRGNDVGMWLKWKIDPKILPLSLGWGCAPTHTWYLCIYIYIYTVIYCHIYIIIVCIHFAYSAPKSQDVLMHWSESMSYVEQLLRDQLVAAIGKARSGSKQSRWSP